MVRLWTIQSETRIEMDFSLLLAFDFFLSINATIDHVILLDWIPSKMQVILPTLRVWLHLFFFEFIYIFGYTFLLITKRSETNHLLFTYDGWKWSIHALHWSFSIQTCREWCLPIKIWFSRNTHQFSSKLA